MGRGVVEREEERGVGQYLWKDGVLLLEAVCKVRLRAEEIAPSLQADGTAYMAWKVLDVC